MSVTENLKALRDLMSQEKIDFYVVPTSDYHSSEYVGDHFRAREFLSGFTGSNGTLLVTADHAALWTDGRYFLQAEEQLKGTGIELMKMRRPGVPALHEYIANNLKKDQTLGFDGRTFSVFEGKQLEDAATQAGAHIKYDLDLVSSIWKERPALSCKPVSVLDVKYTGRSAADKLSDIRNIMKEKDCEYHIVTSLDDIAWILNLRGSDVACNPVFLSYLVISCGTSILFIQENALTDDVRSYLSQLGIETKPYDSIYEYASSGAFKGKNLLIDTNRLNFLLYSILADSSVLKEEQNPSVIMKACKNP
ncbi:MAG: aminopeptidase P family N-terminal domain-containing protein, partial [Lachnospiraceae bacterium]|nr:aminopeptidase P family N-terminal domain-containing protein [Lachnospiraceae bacterium]